MVAPWARVSVEPFSEWMTKVDWPLEIPATDLAIKRISHAVKVPDDSLTARIVKRNSSWTKIKRDGLELGDVTLCNPGELTAISSQKY